MNVARLNPTNCGQVRRQMDDYLSNEVAAGVQEGFQAHLASCKECARELDARRSLRKRLQMAVQEELAPAYLQQRIRARVREARSPASLGRGWLWRAAAVVPVMVAVVLLVQWTRGVIHQRKEAREDAYINEMATRLPGLLPVGFKDQMHCAVYDNYGNPPRTFEAMAKNLGPDYIGLVTLVKSHIPAGYEVTTAHLCGHYGRPVVHICMRKGSSLLGVVITRKRWGESLLRASPPSQLIAGGIPLYQGNVKAFVVTSFERHDYEVAGFESRDYLAYVVSDLESSTNLQIAAVFAPPLNEYLDRLKG